VSRLLALGILALALGLAGCGGDDEDPAEAWANDVCGSIVDYRDTIQGVASDFQSDPGSVSVNSIRDAVGEVGDATTELVDSIRDAGPPDTEAGQQAKTELEGLADRTEQAIEQAQQAAESETSNLTTLITQLTTIAGQVGSIVSDVAATFQQVVNLDGGQELEDGFRDASNCQELQSGSSD
jgi:hypothetical protein